MTAEIQDEVLSQFINPLQVEERQLTGQMRILNPGEEDDFLTTLNITDDLTKMIFKFHPEYTSDITWQGIVRESILPTYHTRNFKKLEVAFHKEIKKRTDYFPTNSDQLNALFEKSAFLIAELPFISSTLEFTKQNAFKFTLGFPQNKLLMISVIVNEEKSSLNKDDIIYSLFINRELIASNAENLTNFVEGFRKYLSM